MNVMIIDDERLAREELKRLLSSFPNVRVTDEAKNGDEAISKIESQRPALIFLDIQMPGKDGFEMLEALDDAPQVIFTTAYDEYAIRAFEFNALDYLLKPIDPVRLEAALNKINLTEPPIETDQSQLSEIDQVFVRDGERCWFVKIKNIRLFESEGNYTRVFFDEFKPLILRSLNQLEGRMDPKLFFRASRQHIINLKWIEKIDPWFDGGLMITMKGGLQIKMSRRQAQKFKALMSL